MSIFQNIPLIAALASNLSAQGVKVPLHYLVSKQWKPSMALSTGGMPSSHSATVTSMATVVGMEQGWSSPVFAVAAIVCAITMYDAAGIRRHAGIHASLINRVVKSLPVLLPNSNLDVQPREELKELLGHRPIEVVGGSAWGIVIGILFYFWFHV